MFGKKETRLRRHYFWTDFSTTISFISIQLKDSKRTELAAGENDGDKNAPYPDASRVLIKRDLPSGDLVLEYFNGDKLLAREIIYGHTISKVEVEFA
jgi:hypothetical protein